MEARQAHPFIPTVSAKQELIDRKDSEKRVPVLLVTGDQRGFFESLAARGSR